MRIGHYAHAMGPKAKMHDPWAPAKWWPTTGAIKLVDERNGTSEIAIDDTSANAALFLTPLVQAPEDAEAVVAGFQVFDPDGVPINERTRFQIPPFLPNPMWAIPLAGHRPGTYTLVHTGRAQHYGLADDALLPSSKLAMNFGLAVRISLPGSKIVMKVRASPGWHMLGDEESVDVALEEAGAPVLGAQITGLLSGPRLASRAPLQFIEVGGGLYRADVSSILGEGDEVGIYSVDVHAEGQSPSGRPFLRSGRAALSFVIPTATISSISGTRVVRDDRGVVAFEVDLVLESKSRDRFQISGTLAACGADGFEHPVAKAYAGGGYDAGTHEVTLRFNAGHVRMTRLEGPYVLRDLALESLGTLSLFYRVGSGLNQVMPSVRRSEMVLPEMTPALEQLVREGVLVYE